MKKHLGLIFASFLMCIPFIHNAPSVKPIETKAATNKRYNLCVFLQFADETSWLDQQEYGNSRLDIIDQTYNKSSYSYRDYFLAVSNNSMDMETVYLFPEETGFSPFMLEGTRESYAKKSDTNPNGYELEGSANALLQIDWGTRIQEAFNKGILPCTIDDRSNTIPLEALDQDNNKTIDSITLVLAPQQSTHYTVGWGEPLYPCKSQSSRISISTSKGTLTSDTYIQYVCDFTSLYKESSTDSKVFLPNATGMHEMGHAFGLLDLYDYNRKYYPVGNMSLMSNLITPIPQFITSREREALGWLNSTNIKEISKSGTYELSPVSTNTEGTICYKMPLEGFENKWLYLEYRVFDDPTINRFDSKNRELYTASGTKVNGIAGKSGVLVYIVDTSNRFPTNSLGQPRYFGIDIFGGTQTNLTDAPKITGDVVSVATYNANGQYLSTDCVVEIVGFENEKAQVKVTSPHLVERQPITMEDIGNNALYEKMMSLITTDILYENSLKNISYLDLSFLDITNLDFLSKFSFDNLKYLVLTGNKITNPALLKDFLAKYPNVLITIDNNNIDLTTLDEEYLNLTQVLYGIQNINVTSGGSFNYTGEITYHINESFSRGDYSISYIGGLMTYTRSLGRGLQSFTIDEDGTYTFTCCYFFSFDPVVKYQYEFNIVKQTKVSPTWSLSSLDGTYKVNEEFTLPLLPNGANPNDFNVSISCNDVLLASNTSTSVSFSETGTYVLTIVIEDKSSLMTQTLTYTAYVVEPSPLTIDLNGLTYIQTVSKDYHPSIYVQKGDNTPIELTTPGVYEGITFSYEVTSEVKMENGEKRSTIYTYTYHVTDEDGMSDTKARTIEVMDPQYLIDNPSDNIQVSVTIYNSNGEVVTTTEPGETYTYEYSFTDEYGQTITYSKEVTIPVEPGEPIDPEEPTDSEEPTDPVEPDAPVDDATNSSKNDKATIAIAVVSSVLGVILLSALVVLIVTRRKY